MDNPPLASAPNILLSHFPLAITRRPVIIIKMKPWIFFILTAGSLMASAWATTIMVVPVFEALSLHGTDGDEETSEIGAALQAAVMSRPMALTGAFPETLVEAVRTPHLIPSSNPNYKVQETNLLVLCNIAIRGEMEGATLTISLDVSQLAIPPEVDLTTRQILKLAIIAVRKTLEEYQRPQPQPLPVQLTIDGTDDAKASLRDLGSQFTVNGSLNPN